MTAWFIIGPKGAVYRDYERRHFCAASKKVCIYEFCAGQSYAVSIEVVWASFERLGYRCEKRRIVE